MRTETQCGGSPLPWALAFALTNFAWSFFSPIFFSFSSLSPSVHILKCESHAERMKGWLSVSLEWPLYSAIPSLPF